MLNQVRGGKVTEFHKNNTLTAQQNTQNLISMWTKPNSGEGFSTVENDKVAPETCLRGGANISKSYLHKRNKTEERNKNIPLQVP